MCRYFLSICWCVTMWKFLPSCYYNGYEWVSSKNERLKIWPYTARWWWVQDSHSTVDFSISFCCNQSGENRTCTRVVLIKQLDDVFIILKSLSKSLQSDQIYQIFLTIFTRPRKFLGKNSQHFSITLGTKQTHLIFKLCCCYTVAPVAPKKFKLWVENLKNPNSDNFLR